MKILRKMSWFHSKSSALLRLVSNLFPVPRAGGGLKYPDVNWYSDTIFLIERLRQSRTLSEFKTPPGSNLLGMPSYCVKPDQSGSLVRFFATDANGSLIRFLDRDIGGVEILQLDRSGFEYHWRSDLIKVLDGQMPYLGRVLIFLNKREVAVDHLCLPIFSGEEIIGFRGWFVCSNGLLSPEGTVDWERVSIVRRTQRTRPISLPRTLQWPEGQSALFYDILRVLKAEGLTPRRKKEGVVIPGSSAKLKTID